VTTCDVRQTQTCHDCETRSTSFASELCYEQSDYASKRGRGDGQPDRAREAVEIQTSNSPRVCANAATIVACHGTRMPGIYKVITLRDAKTVRRAQKQHTLRTAAQRNCKCELQASPMTRLEESDRTRQRGGGDVDDMSDVVRSLGTDALSAL